METFKLSVDTGLKPTIKPQFNEKLLRHKVEGIHTD